MSEEPLALAIGDEVRSIGLSANSQVFVFTPIQMQFIKNLEKLKSVTAACMSMRWPEEYGRRFLKSRKFQRYYGCRMQAMTTKAGMSPEAWWEFCKNLTNGFQKRIVAACLSCKWSEEITAYEYEMARGDDMSVNYRCPMCTQDVKIDVITEPFLPSRERVEGFKEWGARITPKIERTHHTYENVDIVFESQGETP